MKNISRFAIFLLLVCSVAVFSGCSSDGGDSYIKNIGGDASLGGGNTSILAQSLLTCVNELRNSSGGLPAYVWCDNAALACAEYLGNATVTGIWNPPDDEDYLHPGAVIDYWKLTVHYIAPANELLDALTAMKYDTAQEVVDAWANNAKPVAILLHSEYTRMGAACADPNARWVAIFYRP